MAVGDLEEVYRGADMGGGVYKNFFKQKSDDYAHWVGTSEKTA